MTKELLVFVPGLSARAPAKYTVRLVTNLKNYSTSRGESFAASAEDTARAAPEGAAGGSVTFEHTGLGTGAATRQIVFREVVWADIPARLTELSGKDKAWQGLRLLAWASASLITAPRVLWSNTYQSVCIVGALLILLFWYAGIAATLPTVIDWTVLPDESATRLREVLAGMSVSLEAVSHAGLQTWIATSVTMGLLPVTAVVDAAYAMKQYTQDGRTEGRAGLVGEDARVRIANALNEVRKEQAGAGRAAYARITFVAHSFGAVPVIEALAAYGADLRAPVRLITLGAPLAFAGALRHDVSDAARTYMTTGKAERGTALAGWRCIWTRWDYASSDPASLRRAKAPKWAGFTDKRLQGSWSIWLLANHDRYFDEDYVAAAILDLDEPAAAKTAS